jgi:hypothetical protein
MDPGGTRNLAEAGRPTFQKHVVLRWNPADHMRFGMLAARSDARSFREHGKGAFESGHLAGTIIRATAFTRSAGKEE